MDKIKFRFLNYKKYSSFKTALEDGRILDDSIVFIQDKRCIWARGKEYVCDGPYTTNTDSDGNITLKRGDGTIIFKIGQKNGILSISDENGNINTTTYATKKYVDDNIISKQDKLTAGYGINLNNNTISIGIDTDIYAIVDELPLTNISENKIYLVREKHTASWVFGNTLPIIFGETTSVDDDYTQYKWDSKNQRWIKMGQVQPTVNLSKYISRDEAQYTYATIEQLYQGLQDQLLYSEHTYVPKTAVYTEDAGVDGPNNPTLDADDIGIISRGVANTVFLTKQQYQAIINMGLAKHDMYYFTYEGDDEIESWAFGGTFPITLI